jgi:hypothetical protein
VFNRYPNANDEKQTLHVAKYMFPRQFDLHNVFTSDVDSRQTAQQFQDYALREQEIHRTELNRLSKLPPLKMGERAKAYAPKRLRGQVMDFVRRIRKGHQQCAYVELLQYYCAVGGVRSTGNAKSATYFALLTLCSSSPLQASNTTKNRGAQQTLRRLQQMFPHSVGQSSLTSCLMIG